MYDMKEEFVNINSVRFDAGDFYYDFSNYSYNVDDKGLVISYKESEEAEPTEISIYNLIVITALRDFINQHILNE